MEVGGEVRIEGVRLERVIGRGASSVVYLGTQTRFDRQVAVKVLDLPGQSELVSRLFLNESRTVGRLTAHPNIVTLFDCGTDSSGRPYLVMEYLPDGTLAAELAESGPFPAERVLRIGVQLAGALHTTHLHDIVHGDVKPQNLLRTRTGEVAIGDFGVARLLSAGAASTRVPLLTPLHAAPELFDGAAPTPRTDVYELCSTLFELLDGRPAVGDAEESPLLIVGRLARGERRSLDRVGVPAPVAELVESGLSVDPEGRPADAAALGEALRALQEERGETPTPLVVFDQLPPGDAIDGATDGDPSSAHTLPPPRRPRRRSVVGLVAALVLVAAGFGLLLGLRSDPSPEVASATTERDGPPASDAGSATSSTTVAIGPPTTERPAGLQPDVTYDTTGSGRDTSLVLAEQLGDGAEVFAPMGPAQNVVSNGVPGIRQLPATFRWQAYNAATNPDCPGFLSRPMTLTGAWEKQATSPTTQAGVSVRRFETRDQAAEAFVALSMEAGAEEGECRGLSADGEVVDQERLAVEHRDADLPLPSNDASNNWLSPPPPGVTQFTSVRTGIVLLGDTVVTAYAADVGGPVTPEVFAALLTGPVERLTR